MKVKKNWGRTEKRPCYLELDGEKFEITEDYIRESRKLRVLYVYDYCGRMPVPIKGKNSTIIKKALQFCKERGQIRKKHDIHPHPDLFKADLKDFDHNFLQQNLNDAIPLLDIAFRLRIKNLYYLMREAAVKMIDDQPADKIHEMFKIHYEKDTTSDINYQEMRRAMSAARWAYKPIN